MPHPVHMRRQPARPFSRGLVALYDFEEAAGAALLDGFGGLHLTANNSPGSVGGKFGLARSYAAASSQSHTIPSTTSLQLNAGDASVLCWLWINDLAATRYAYAKASAITGTGIEWAVRHSGTALQVVMSNGAALQTNTMSTNAPTGQWVAFGWEYLAATREFRCRQDDLGWTANGVTALTGGPVVGSGTFAVGKGGAGSAFFDGRADLLLPARRRWSETEWAWLINRGQGRSPAEILAYSTFQIHVDVILARWRERGLVLPRAEALWLPRIPAHRRGRRAWA